MPRRLSTDTSFHIDFAWWERQGRNLRSHLVEMLDDDTAANAVGDQPLDYIDPVTAEVLQLDPVWTTVLVRRAHRPDYITPSTPVVTAVLRALIENVNRPMTIVELQRRINRGTPESLLRVMPSARAAYGIVPATE